MNTIVKPAMASVIITSLPCIRSIYKLPVLFFSFNLGNNTKFFSIESFGKQTHSLKKKLQNKNCKTNNCKKNAKKLFARKNKYQELGPLNNLQERKKNLLVVGLNEKKKKEKRPFLN